MVRRIFYNLIILGSLFLLPLWATFVITVIASFLVPYRFYEFIWFGILVDIMYGTYTVGWFHLPVYTFVGVATLCVIHLVKKRMNVYV